MSVGESGRIVLEIDPLVKKQLYQTLKTEGLCMKDWFLIQANQLLTQETPPTQSSLQMSQTKTEGNVNR